MGNRIKRKRAVDVLSPGLLREIQKYYSGGYLRIPKSGVEKRNEKIRALRKKGLLQRQIAENMDLSERTIRRILQETARPDKNTET